MEAKNLFLFKERSVEILKYFYTFNGINMEAKNLAKVAHISFNFLSMTFI
jgi:hypothetical protein